MTKKLSAVTGQYQKDGQTKAEWTNVGVLITGSNGKEYVLLDPTVNLAGILVKQNILAQKEGKPLSESVMTSVFEEQNNQAQQNGGYQQQAPQQPMQQQNMQPNGQPMTPQQVQQQNYQNNNYPQG